MRLKLWLGLLVSAGSFALSAGAQAAGPPFTECPAVGQDTSCQIEITVTNSGQSYQTDSTQGPYEGQEDSLIGVVNGTTHTVTSLQLSGGGIFGFDGDGICHWSTGAGHCRSRGVGPPHRAARFFTR